MALFSRVLVANRGEIACRVIRACHKLGLQAVAVYSEADAGALHTELADDRISIGQAAARESYLRAERLIEAALRSGAQAVHPGYGFLAESPCFAQAVRDAGLIWVGPEPRTIADMGDKQRARDIALQAGVPVLPGSRAFRAEEPVDALHAAATEVGYPLLVKAAAGGGGIGMRLVTSADELPGVVSATQSLCKRSFGDGAVYFERFIASARHVEVQVFGDGKGRAVHLFERDCSIQRRYQKVVEESPVPNLPDTLRLALTEAAVRLAEIQRYAGPGTVEFLVDAAGGRFYFLEMNTRVQVEHCVTEMVTGLDIVAMQLALANGESSMPAQDGIRVRGHAIECRVCAEDPKAGLRPSTGRLSRFDLGPPSDDVRIETGYRAGDVVSMYYDSLLAKIIVWAPDRASAVRRMAEALDHARVEQVATNLSLLRAILTHPSFAAAEVDTRFLEQHAMQLGLTPAAKPAHVPARLPAA
ncbi:MAG TPA: biotin carboxylase N-terminal domain-containing protein [Steroidobacter sp.]|uniref:acetyl-CoA carboxylase biotin carboxylase subunit n=1 Tax=Steroidobacter sp. TaxID=1978227 RepID=UPI002ED7CA63